MITIVLTISRDDNLDLVFHSLEMLDLAAYTVNLLCVVDGDATLYEDVRNRCERSRFSQRLTVQFGSDHRLRHYDLAARRLRISDIHNFVRDQVKASEYLFLIEDDGILPQNALTQLMDMHLTHPFAGFVSGIQLGRHGIAHAGLWKVDDPYEPKRIESTMQTEGIIEVDAAGFYAMLTRAEIYMAHEFKPFGNNDLGPDFEYGIDLRTQGYSNYADLSVVIPHLTKDKKINLMNTQIQKVTMTLNEKGRWRHQKVV